MSDKMMQVVRYHQFGEAEVLKLEHASAPRAAGRRSASSGVRNRCTAG